ncbi:sensor histidine kinase [Bradyrhizobium sp. RDI18]|uniref:sensor histidine kinase n=1 Tax=Bradyrhizobium sp. RDI18 TaxID=3367400 RepID=UPI003721B3ED
MNALDATAHKAVNERVITVQTKRSDNWAEFSTADTGPGVPPEQLSRIFEPFFSTKPNGMGMGLSIARTIVEFHGGIINIQNRSSGGAIVIVRLPLIR